MVEPSTQGRAERLKHCKAYTNLEDLRECDVIMKGGITIGVLYPLEVCELAVRYRLRSTGGTSSDAIAAAAAAAAEYGRLSQSPGSGFDAFARRKLGYTRSVDFLELKRHRRHCSFKRGAP